MIKPIAYGALERDLCRLAGDRVGQAILSVLQLADDPGQGVVIAIAAHAEAAAMLAGAFAKAEGISLDKVDPLDIAIAVLERQRKVAAEKGEGR